MVQETQDRIADGGAIMSFMFANAYLVGILEAIGLVLTIGCAAFSLYFHIKRYLRERKKGNLRSE